MTRLPYIPETPSQTAGPFLHIGLLPDRVGLSGMAPIASNVLVSNRTQGERIAIEGRVFDGTGSPCRDVLIELWQADAQGRYPHPADAREGQAPDPAFSGFGRTGTDFATGLFRFETVKPGRVAGRHGYKPMAPHVSLWLAARGINVGLSTRMYFSDEAEANAADPVLAIIEQPSRRLTLIGHREERADGIVYVFDIHLQGERETVFFDV
ncbi:MAG TPA: protocatechuate 3,4-dioxygenase subunit alpha [Beijerinckiaceae bacterium]|jgi:protocatechuate 3,4-dioxygenase alpha subunit